MNTFFRFFSLLLISVLTVSCSEEEESKVVITDNPYDLNSASDLTVYLGGLNEIGDCVTVDYPVTVLTYVSAFEIGETITINSDAELTAFFNALGEGENFAFQFPIMLSGFEDEEITINSNEEFSAALQGEVAECEAAAACITDNTLFTQLYNQVKAVPDVTEEFSMDAMTHEYTFNMTVAGSICSIGYKAEEMTIPIAYLIEILDSNGAPVYVGSHSFSSTEVEYVSITPVAINAEEEYTIRRSITTTDAGTGIGTVLVKPQDTEDPLLQQSLSVMTILRSSYYDDAGTGVEDLYSVPQIDFVFKPE